MRDAFVNKIIKLAEKNKDLYVLTGDLGFSVFESFQAKFPRRFINAGIAEANMMGVAAGLAMSGKTALTYSIIPFTVTRCLEQIKVDVCYQNTDVKIVGVGAGLAYGVLGATHQAIEDIAVMRAFPNMKILSPCDSYETEAAVELAVRTKGPVYIRLGKNREPKIHAGPVKMEFGGSATVKNGKDAVVFVTGSIMTRVIEAERLLWAKGVDLGIVSVYSLKPLDRRMIMRHARKTGKVITVEEHNVIGGLGSAVGDCIIEAGADDIRIRKIGMDDCFSKKVGSQSYLLDQYGFSPASIADKIYKFIKN